MSVLTKYSIVCQVPGADLFTICPYNGTDLSQVLGISQADLPEGHYGWIQECGEALINVSSQTQPAYVDFRPNAAKCDLKDELSKVAQEQDKNPFAQESLERLSQLPPLLMESGVYCALIREARDVFVSGYFYACVAMCGISLERFQRDKAAPFRAARKKIEEVRRILQKNDVLSQKTLDLCEKMAKLRDKYAHGHGSNPEEDALKALVWMHSFIDNETNLMRHYKIVNGVLFRNV
jgi:hypothetical protein